MSQYLFALLDNFVMFYNLDIAYENSEQKEKKTPKDWDKGDYQSI